MVMPRGRGRPRHKGLSCPETLLVVLANRFQLLIFWLWRLRNVAEAQLPTCVFKYVVHFNSRMNGREIRFSVFSETQHSFRGNDSGRPSPRETNTLTPSRAVSVARAGRIRNALGQALFYVFQENYKPTGERCDVTSPSGTG